MPPIRCVVIDDMHVVIVEHVNELNVCSVSSVQLVKINYNRKNILLRRLKYLRSTLTQNFTVTIQKQVFMVNSNGKYSSVRKLGIEYLKFVCQMISAIVRFLLHFYPMYET